MKGTYYNLEKKEYKDPTTGIKVLRMTDNKAFHSLTDKKYIDFNNLPSRKVLFCPFEYLYNISLLCYVVLLTFLFTF